MLIISACSSKPESSEQSIEKPEQAAPEMVSYDLEQIKKDGKLKAITIFSPTGYFIYKGQPMGFEYELLERLAQHLGLELEIVVAHNMNWNKLLAMLNSGEGDIIAHGLTVTEDRREYINFTQRYFETHQVLVQRKPENWRQMKLHNIDKELIMNPLDLIGKEVHVRVPSAYNQRLINLQDEMGGEINIKAIQGDIPTAEIIKMVVDGEIDYTIADNYIADINATYYHILDTRLAVSFPQRIAWAVRKNSPALLEAINSWIDKMKTETDYYVIYKKYFENKKLYRERIRSEYSSIEGGMISEYDGLVKAYANQIGWDWRLLSSLLYQESRFDPHAHSWAGGKGLMQLMPATAEELGVTNRSDPEQNIKGGTKYLDQIFNRWDDIPDSIQRIKFTLASYNCGYQHVRDAQRLAVKNQVPGIRWDNEIDEYILMLAKDIYFNDEVVKYGYVRGEEPFNYVREIFERYDQYCKFFPE